VIAAGAVAVTSMPGVSKQLTALVYTSHSDIIPYKVHKVKLPVTVNERGNLESAKNEDVHNEVEGMTTIIFIVPEGTPVKKDQKVCELDSAALRDNLTNQEIATKRAEADYEQAKKTREVAEIAVKEYVQGIFPQDEQSAEGQIKLAESELVKAKDKLDWSTKMEKIGYVTKTQLFADKLAREKAEFTLKESKTKLDVLRNFTKEKQVKDLQAAVEKAKSDELAKQQTYDLEKTKERKLNTQISKCVLKAPNDGLVVYANEQQMMRGGSNQPMIEEGAQVRERQKIFSLPDINHMRVNTKVHESMVDRVKQGQRGRIRVDAFPAEQLGGAVRSVQPLPDPTNFFSSDIKVYTTLVDIDTTMSGLRPGMTAQVEILIEQLDDVLAVPIQAILEFKGKDHVYVITPDGPVRREVKVGTSNERLVQIVEGLKDGEEVAMNPGALLTDQERRDAFAVASKGTGKKDWSADAAKYKANGLVGADGKAKADGGSAKAKGKGKRQMPAFFTKLRSLSQEERAQLKTGSEEEKMQLYKKAGMTDEEIEQMKQFRANFGGGGGGFGGGPPGGGFGGGGGGGFGGGGGGGGGGQPQ
jgi:RND family efflux transporter MFP subunit